MTKPVRKKLIEVALPLEAINVAAAREKSIHHGHPSTLHLWWARRPLAAARAVIFAQMVDDPSGYVEELTNPGTDSRRAAERELKRKLQAWDALPSEAKEGKPRPTLEEVAIETERQRLFGIIEELVQWENTTNEEVLQKARDEIWRSWRRTCAQNADHPLAKELFDRHRLPAFHDPFAGGGALPLEAQRLGLESHASDLNPVAVLINKAMIEIPPKFANQPPVNPDAQANTDLNAWQGAQGLAEDVRYYGKWMRDEAAKRIGHLYPKVEVVQEADGSYRCATEEDARAGRPRSELTVIAWIWARTVKSPNPAFRDVDVPLASTFMLSTKPGKEAYVEPVIEGRGYRFVVKTGKPKDVERAKRGTKLSQGAFECLMSGSPFKYEYVDDEANADRMGARLMAIVAEGQRGRVYLSPTEKHARIATTAAPRWKPDLASRGTWASNAQGRVYGFKTFGDYFTPRQLTALTTFSDLLAEARERVKCDFLGTRASRPRSPFHRTRLPHWEAGETPQHITFRLADSLPQAKLAEIEAELERLPADERSAAQRERIEAWLDAGHGDCLLGDLRLARLVENALLHFDGTRYRLHEWAVMPNHVHALITPLHGNSLSSIVQSWKSFTAKEINKAAGRSGSVWQADYFDRMIRNDEHFARTAEYVRTNPARAGIPESQWVCSATEDWSEGVGSDGVGSDGVGSEGVSPSERASADDERAGRPRSARERRAGRPPSEEAEAEAYADAVATYLAFAVDKCSDYWSSICTWHNSGEKMRNTFGRQAIPMSWDFTEANPYCSSTGNWMAMVDWTWKALATLPASRCGHASSNDAATQSTSAAKVVSTDPPYYDNIGYADLSDFFYVWLRKSLRDVYPDLFATIAVPKAEELVATPYRHGGKHAAEKFFLDGMTRAMGRICELAHPAFPVTIYYAFKQSETTDAGGQASTGWETFLEAVIRSGFALTGTWPMRTELGNRMIGSGTNALASSIVLVCRRRDALAPTATRREFLNALQRELPKAVADLQRGNVAPVDLQQAAIGPGMAIFTRYAKVLDADGNPLTVRNALTMINQSLDEVLAHQEGDFDGDTRWAIAWFEQFGLAEGYYGTAEVLSKAKATSVQGIVDAGIAVSGKGKVRLLRPEELLDSWTPESDQRLTVWDMVHHLIRVLEQGEGRAADLMAKLGTQAEVARELAYRLYSICDRKKWSADAARYNALVQSWSEVVQLSQSAPQPEAKQQESLGL